MYEDGEKNMKNKYRGEIDEIATVFANERMDDNVEKRIKMHSRNAHYQVSS